MTLQTGHFANKKIAIVANRAPARVVRRKGREVLEKGVGGLVSALEPVIEAVGGMWFCTSTKSQKFALSRVPDLPYQIHQIELSDREVHRYYEGFSNKQLWPICHYFPMMCAFNAHDWEVYRSVNKKMAKAILENVDEDFLVWIHDYHFLLLPALLREGNPNLNISFFLHIPFPNQEVFRLLANRNELMSGLLGADLIGFHTSQYVEHFINCAHMLLPQVDVDKEKNVLIKDDRKIFAKNFPISIDFNDIQQRACSEKVLKKATKLRLAFQSELIGISVDRVDYSKGPIERLEAIEHFFEVYPEYLKKISFIQISVPSRTNIKTYQELKKKVDEITGRINGKFSKEGWSPIHYSYSTLPFNDLLAHYIISDIALVVPLRDGMNLVAKEYVASRINDNGVLVLSEFAGAAEELTRALLVNPYQKDFVAKAIKDAIEMPTEIKTERMQSLRKNIKNHDIFHWVNDYFCFFHKAVEENRTLLTSCASIPGKGLKK